MLRHNGNRAGQIHTLGRYAGSSKFGSCPLPRLRLDIPGAGRAKGRHRNCDLLHGERAVDGSGRLCADSLDWEAGSAAGKDRSLTRAYPEPRSHRGSSPVAIAIASDVICERRAGRWCSSGFSRRRAALPFFAPVRMASGAATRHRREERGGTRVANCRRIPSWRARSAAAADACDLAYRRAGKNTCRDQ